MRLRWYYLKRMLRANRGLMPVLIAVIAAAVIFWSCRHGIAEGVMQTFRMYGVQAAGRTMKEMWPALAGEEEKSQFFNWLEGRNLLFSFLQQMEDPEFSEDPAYERLLAQAWQEKQNRENQMGQESPAPKEPVGQDGHNEEVQDAAATPGLTGEAISTKAPGQTLIFDKLADYDYMMNSFYSIHPTTTAGRDLMSAEKFLGMDFTIEKKEEPQILIYHTHSQEEFADYPENPDATIVGVGTYLAELLEQKGYQVIHDTSVYDLRDGKLDRSQAYTYALDGISGILQKYPSIEVVLDVHRDGVKEGTRLVKEIGGKPTAQIMFFNGMSQTPDGPIEYLPNPNRDFNLGFSFQMQLKAAENFPGFTRKIYLKGLRYNEHVRARAALIEVGAQTNTYEEARNAMEPLAEILDGVLQGS